MLRGLALVDVPELVFVAVAVVETLMEDAGLALLSPRCDCDWVESDVCSV